MSKDSQFDGYLVLEEGGRPQLLPDEAEVFLYLSSCSLLTRSKHHGDEGEAEYVPRIHRAQVSVFRVWTMGGRTHSMHISSNDFQSMVVDKCKGDDRVARVLIAMGII